MTRTAPVEPLITVTIPTFNRLAILEETLDRLAQQEGFLDGDIELVVSDNASPVDPLHMLAAFTARCGKPVVFSRNATNVGIDGNIHAAGRLATGRYLLFMSDDDVLLPGAIGHLRGVIARHDDLLFCFVNGYPFPGQFAEAVVSPPIIELASTLTTRSADLLLETIWIWSTFLSSFFVERKAWTSVAGAERFIGTDIYLTHVLFRLLTAEPRRTKVVAGTPWMAARMEYTGSFRIFHAFGSEFMRLLCRDAPALGFSVRSMRKVKLRTIRSGLPPMIMMVRRGQKPRRLTLKELRALFRFTWYEPLAWVTLVPLVVLPDAILDLLRSIKRNRADRNRAERQAPTQEAP